MDNDAATLAPSARHDGRAPAVVNIFPSADTLPENLLRFYVQFSKPMSRGYTREHIRVLGPDGNPAADVLYRAPVELWDRQQRWLTVLLDPGRLKRGLGPNAALGPPLKAGQDYVLHIAAGLPDATTQRTGEAASKRFRVGPPVREPVRPDRWTIVTPPDATTQPMVARFDRPLDRALLPQCLQVIDPTGTPVQGQGSTGNGETEWRFCPSITWLRGSYRLRVAPWLEDVCGNSVAAAFDAEVTGSSVEAVVRLSVQFDV